MTWLFEAKDKKITMHKSPKKWYNNNLNETIVSKLI